MISLFVLLFAGALLVGARLVLTPSPRPPIIPDDFAPQDRENGD